MAGTIDPGTVICALVGPTATGKTAVAAKVAPEINAEVLSVDSMQVYRGMDIGTSKPSPEEMAAARYHLLDVVDPSESFSAALYKRMADEAIAGVVSRRSRPMLVGGSGLYYRAVVDDLDFSGAGGADSYRVELREELEEMDTHELHVLLRERDPGAAEQIPTTNRRRILRALEVARDGLRPMSDRQSSWSDFESPYELIAAGLDTERALLYRLIDLRVDDMMTRGLEGEVRALEGRGLKRGTTAGEALGYRQMLDYLGGGCTLDEAVREIKKRTRNYAKRQLTWFKRDPRIRWFTVEGDSKSSPEDLARSVGETAALVLEYFRDKLDNYSS